MLCAKTVRHSEDEQWIRFRFRFVIRLKCLRSYCADTKRIRASLQILPCFGENTFIKEGNGVLLSEQPQQDDALLPSIKNLTQFRYVLEASHCRMECKRGLIKINGSGKAQNVSLHATCASLSSNSLQFSQKVKNMQSPRFFGTKGLIHATQRNINPIQLIATCRLTAYALARSPLK